MTTNAEAWAGMSVKEWAKLDPEFPKRILDSYEREVRHIQRIAWACLWSAVFALLVLAGVALYFVSHQAASEGALVFGAGSVSIVGLFVTNRFVVSRKQRPSG
jgi:hypothetical protein